MAHPLYPNLSSPYGDNDDVDFDDDDDDDDDA